MFVNAKAMALSHITRATKNPTGGEILKDASGDPVGLLRERASGLIDEPELQGAEREANARKVLELAAQEALSKGITTFEDAGSPLPTIDLMKKMVDEGRMPVRLWVMVRQANAIIGPKLKRLSASS